MRKHENKIIAINNNGIDKIIFDINDCSIQIRNIFNEIETIVDDTKNHFNCSTADIFRKKFYCFKSNFNIITNNLLTFKNDLKKIKEIYIKEEHVLANIIDDESRKVIEKDKKEFKN